MVMSSLNFESARGAKYREYGNRLGRKELEKRQRLKEREEEEERKREMPKQEEKNKIKEKQNK